MKNKCIDRQSFLLDIRTAFHAKTEDFKTLIKSLDIKETRKEKPVKMTKEKIGFIQKMLSGVGIKR